MNAKREKTLVFVKKRTVKMADKISNGCFHFVVMFFVLLLISFGISGISAILTLIKVEWTFIPVATIPYDVIGWFWMAISSIYVGGTALLNVFTSRSLQDLSRVETSSGKLKKITYMNYFACLFCFGLVLLGVNIPLEAIVSAAGSCTILIVAGKKASVTAIQKDIYDEEVEIENLKTKIHEGEIKGTCNGNMDALKKELDERIKKLEAKAESL